MDLVTDPDNSSVEPHMKTLQRPPIDLSVDLRVQAGAQSEHLDSHCVGHKRVELGARIALDLWQFVRLFCSYVFAMF
ncbi:hypothetical protein K3495_g14316 [Podosphaera aphanis]|nr:hypothetical protein K3495_g14316 [Podosphaera aphanis]